jgi:hypothetical protein
MGDTRPSCFGIPENCMPRDDNGIIQPQKKCRHCEHLRDCLQTAIAACGGVEKIKSESGARPQVPSGPKTAGEPGGIVGAVLRWSDRKRAAQKGGTD